MARQGDLDTDTAALTPDLPVLVATTDARGTAARWGTVPRTYIRCTEDRALPLALQDHMIREADDFTPANPFRVVSLQ